MKTPAEIKVLVVSLNETPYYNLRVKDVPLIKAIHGVYILDTNEHTYCCELTPSYHLEHVYNNIEFVGDLSDDLRDELQGRYCYELSENHYSHVSNVNALPAAQKYESKQTFESMDDAREYFQGNCPL